MIPLSALWLDADGADGVARCSVGVEKGYVMKDCTHCKWAKWDRTPAGKLHPLGGGECTKKIVIPELPASRYWLHSGVSAGGFISRKTELKTHCAYYERNVK